jgi:GNAT superfamily N-acetyltransferase
VFHAGIVPAMGISWDMLQPLMTVPYVPTLGPAHPQAVTPGLFNDVVEIAGTGGFLPHDKDRRWADRKEEQVLPDAIIQELGLAMIPTLRTGRASCIRVCIYSCQPQSVLNRAAELGRRLSEQHDAANGRLTWFLPPGSNPDPVAACTRIQMQNFSPAQTDIRPEAPIGVVPLDLVPGAVRRTFSAFAEKLAADGFAFLDARIRDGRIGPVLTVQRDGMVVGAIGPMEIMPDSRGTARLLPQYFGVLPGYRGRGIGRLLWRAAMRWGQRHQAAYQLLQTQVGGASDRLCQSEGLNDLGLVCTTTP